MFNDSKDRKQKIKHFINFYNTVKPHKAISGETPYKFLEDYFNHEV
ncbi:transposase [Gilliamella apicola]